jgi:excisionase family DNA binding protein
MSEHAPPITVTVKTFCALSGIGKTKAFEMIKDGTLESIKIGNNRLIVMESFWRLVRQGSPETANNGGGNGGKV